MTAIRFAVHSAKHVEHDLHGESFGGGAKAFGRRTPRTRKTVEQLGTPNSEQGADDQA